MHYFIFEIFGNTFIQMSKALYGDAMFVFLSGAQIWKPTETSVVEFSYECVNSLLKELIKIKVIFILRQGMFR